MTQKTKKIIFLSSKSEAELYLRLNKTDESLNIASCLFIAMNPEVYVFLKNKGIPAKNTLDYFSWDSHKEALETSNAMVDWLRERASFSSLGININSAYRNSLIYWLRFSIHYCLWVAEIVTNSIEAHQPEVLCAPVPEKGSPGGLYVGPADGYLGYIAKTVSRKKNLVFENIPSEAGNAFGMFFLRLKRYITYAVKFTGRRIKFNLFSITVFMSGVLNKKRPVFFTTRFYQMDKLAKETQGALSDRKFYFLGGPAISDFKIPNLIIRLFWNKHSGQIIAQKNSFKALEEEMEKETLLFSHKGISFSSILAKKVRDNISDYIIGFMLWSLRLNNFIDSSRAEAFISNGNRADDIVLAELCRNKNIPTVLISHGTHTAPKNKYENIEWGEHGRQLLRAPFSHLALQSPLCEEYLEIFPSKAKRIRTGPLIWGRPVNTEAGKLLFRKLFNGKSGFKKDMKILMHAGTPKPSRTLRFYVYEMVDEYIKALCDLSTAVSQIPNCLLIIKFRPTDEISVETLKGLVGFSERVILSVDEPFSDVLALADLLVSFSSTSIEEALQNNIPALLYGGCPDYQHVSAYEIKPGGSVLASALYHVSNAKLLKYAIENILKVYSVENNYLFERYIYPHKKRTSLTDLLNSLDTSTVTKK